MSVTEQIPQQNFEIVEAAIASTLAIDIAHQINAHGLESAEIFSERIRAVSAQEGVVVNVLFDSIDNETQHERGAMIEAKFFVDIYASGVAQSESQRVDYISSSKLLRMLGVCAYILRSHKNRFFGLPTGLIGNKTVSRVQIYDQEGNQDKNMSRMGRITVSTRIVEDSSVWNGTLLDNNLTSVTLEETNKGLNYKLKAI